VPEVCRALHFDDLIRIGPRILYEFMSNRVVDDVLGNLAQILIPPQDMIPVRSLPELSSVTQGPCCIGRVRLEAMNQLSHGRSVGNQPVEMIGHEAASQGLRVVGDKGEEGFRKAGVSKHRLPTISAERHMDRMTSRIAVQWQAVSAAVGRYRSSVMVHAHNGRKVGWGSCTSRPHQTNRSRPAQRPAPTTSTPNARRTRTDRPAQRGGTGGHRGPPLQGQRQINEREGTELQGQRQINEREGTEALPYNVNIVRLSGSRGRLPALSSHTTVRTVPYTAVHERH